LPAGGVCAVGKTPSQVTSNGVPEGRE